jgi:hypothetical protein
MSRPIPYTSAFIDPMNWQEIQYWADDLQVSLYDLRAAITLVGPRLSDLRRHFGKSAQIIILEKKRTASVRTA